MDKASSPTRKSIPVHFRFPVHQTSEREIMIEIPLGNGPRVLHPDFIAAWHLSDAEVDDVETGALRRIAILPD